MASAFTITTPSNAILLGRERRGAAVFTVANQTGRSVRTRVSVSPFAPTPAEWFSIDGEVERLFAPGAADAFTVRIVAPEDAAAGSYAFRLDAVAADRPDEEWAHGPLVGFELQEPPPPPPPPPPPKGYVETLLGALAGSVASGLLGVLSGGLVIVAGFALPVSTFALFVRLIAPGALGLAIALGGAIGAVVALQRRGLADAPPPWRTAVAYGGLSFVLSTVVQLVLARVLPLFGVGAPSLPAGIAVTLVALVVVVIVSALAGRAYSRYRALGTV